MAYNEIMAENNTVSGDARREYQHNYYLRHRERIRAKYDANREELLARRPAFQLLCYNCNLGRYHNGGTCPHKDQGSSAA